MLQQKQNPWVGMPKESSPGRTGSLPTRGLTLLSGVCRQLYHETALLPYQLNTWSFENTHVMERFVVKERRLSRFQRRALHTLFVEGSLNPAMEKFFGGLKVLLVGDGTKLTRVAVADKAQSQTQHSWRKSRGW